MHIIKKCLSVMLAAVLILQAGALTALALGGENEKRTIIISDIDTSQLTGLSAGSPTEIRTEGIPSGGVEIVSEEWTGPAEYVISGTNITIKDGKYSYRLVIRSDRTLTFDNDLEIFYQGVNGRYRLHYDIDETDNHTMIVTGVFENIIVSSPLLDKISAADREWILSHISEDSYFYQLVLKTKEGFSFVNMLRFMFDAKKCGYSLKYCYDLLTNRQTLIISGVPDCSGNEAETDAPAEQPADPDTIAPVEKPAEQVTDTAVEKPAYNGPAGNEPQDAGAADACSETKADTGLPAAKATVKVRYGSLRKKTQTLAMPKAVLRGQGKVTYIKGSGNKKITINKKTGRITVKKGLRKGAYRVTVKLRPAGRAASAVRSVTITVRVV